MTKFVVRELRLLSRKEKSAFQMTFHPKATVIRGENDTGKSSIVKSIFWCFGADPAITSDRWTNIDVCGAVEFSIDDRVLTIVRHARQFGIFDEAGNVLHAFNRITHGLGPYLAKLFGFGLLLNNKRTGKPETPPPAYFLLPYYIDQDAGWKDTWCSFANLSQYVRYKPDVAEYHVGLHDNHYYRLKTAISSDRAAIEDPKRQERALVKATEQVRTRLAAMPVDFDLSRFQQEVDELVKMASGLADDEEQHRRKAGELSNKRAFLEHQIQIAKHAIGELDKDYDYAIKQPHDVECPTCGASYENSVVERFRLARDESRCTELLTDFRQEIGEIDDKLSGLRTQTVEARQRHGRIWELLDMKRDTITLYEVLQGEARGQAIGALQGEIDSIRETIQGLEGQIEKAQDDLKSFGSKERKKDFLERFSTILDRYSIALRIASPSPVKSFHFKINETGSDLPRAILAYSFAVLHFAWTNDQVARAPLVLDSPNQQDQDAANLLTMVQFIRDRVPEGQQLILGLVDPQGVDFGGSEIVLTTKCQVMSADLYDSIGLDVQRMVNAMYEHSEAQD
jgi:hypothetical protein